MAGSNAGGSGRQRAVQRRPGPYELATEPGRPLLRRALELAVPGQQLYIAVALARIHDPAALKPLADAAQSKDPEIRRQVARSLGECGLMEGTNALSVLLGDTDPAVREQAQTAIGQITVAGERREITERNGPGLR